MVGKKGWVRKNIKIEMKIKGTDKNILEISKNSLKNSNYGDYW